MMKDSFKKIAEVVSGNKSTILIVVSMAGVVITAVATGIGVAKAKDIIDENDGVITKDVAKDVAVVMTPAVLALGGTLVVDILLHKSYETDVAKYAAMAALYASDSKKLEELKAKYIDSKTDANKATDESKEESKEVLIADIADDSSCKVVEMNDIPSGNIRIYDKFRGTFVSTTYKDIFKARDFVNQNLTAGDEVWAQDFYDMLGVEDIGDAMRGYHWIPYDEDEAPWVHSMSTRMLVIEFDAMMDDNMNVYPTFKFNIDPEAVDK